MIELPNITGKEYTKERHNLVRETIVKELSDANLPLIVDNITYTYEKSKLSKVYTMDSKLLEHSINPDKNYELYSFYAETLRLGKDCRGFGYYSEVSFFYVIRYYYDYEFIPKITISKKSLEQIFNRFLTLYPEIKREYFEFNCDDYENLNYSIYDIYVFNKLVNFLRDNETYLRMLII